MIDGGPPAPDLAVIVLVVGASPMAVDAVRSLLNQKPPVEILVVNTGGGDMAGVLASEGIEVPVVEREDLLYVGAARNIGIKATKAPYVAFLASDCLATKDWAAKRMFMHNLGFAAVGSSLANSHRRNPFAWASHLTVFPWRQPKLKRRGLPYGASYDRRLFDEFGYFLEDVRVGEDSEFNARLPADKKPVWQPRVITVHRNPTTFTALLRDNFGRGKRAAQVRDQLATSGLPFGFYGWWRRTTIAVRMSRHAARRDRRYVRMALPIIPFATAAYCLGAWRRKPDAGASSRVQAVPGQPAARRPKTPSDPRRLPGAAE